MPDSCHSPDAVFARLSAADQDLALRLVRLSGSLKDLARHNGVSYPTIRARLDRLIARIEELVAGATQDPMADKLADLIEQGQITPAAARATLELHRETLARSLQSQNGSHD